jgi:hypothetical protein
MKHELQTIFEGSGRGLILIYNFLRHPNTFFLFCLKDQQFDLRFFQYEFSFRVGDEVHSKAEHKISPY